MKIDQIKIQCGNLLIESDLKKSTKINLLNIIENEKNIKVLEQFSAYLNKRSLLSKFIPSNINRVIKMDFSKCNSKCRHLNTSLEMRICIYQCKLAKKQAECKLIKSNFKNICKTDKVPAECNRRGFKRIYKLQRQILNIQDVIKYTEQKINQSSERDNSENYD
jgi:hypothetical protein